MKWCDAFWQQQMYGDGDSPFGYSVSSNVVENDKGIMDLGEFLDGANGELVDGENMTQFASQESDLFKAPISAEPSSINSCSPNEDFNLVAEQIALMGLNLQEDIMLYSCDGNQGLTSSMIQSSPIPSDIAANFLPGLINTVEDILNIKPFSFQSHSLPSGPIGTNESVIQQILRTEGNLPFGHSSSPISLSGQSPSVFSSEVRKTLEDIQEAESLFEVEPMNIDNSTSHPELGSAGDLVVGDSLISETMESPFDALEKLWNAETVSNCQRPVFPSKPMKINSFSGNPPLGSKENNAVGISSSSISKSMQTSSDVSIGVTNRVELLDAKPEPASQILHFSPAMSRPIDSIHQPILVSEENVAIGNSYSSVGTYFQNSPPKIQRRWSTFDLVQLGASPQVTDTFQSSPSPPLNYSMMKVEPKTQFLDFQGSNMTPSPSMRRVYSTGDLKSCQGAEDQGFRIGQYTREERKLVVNKYKKKRSRRDFNKKIKYACRKSLADNQPRCQGRFAPKTPDEGRNSAKPNALAEKDLDEAVWIGNVLYKVSVHDLLSKLSCCGLAEVVKTRLQS